MLTMELEEGGTMSRVKEEGKSAFVGRQGGVMSSSSEAVCPLGMSGSDFASWNC
jgi:hypothetical protein